MANAIPKGGFANGKGEIRSAVGETGDRVKGRAIVFAAIEGGKERSGYRNLAMSGDDRLLR